MGGHVTFVMKGGQHDQYKGEFRNSMFNGLGTFSWASGHSLSGFFADNICSKVGRKVYPDGQMYLGELQADLEHGKGVMIEAPKWSEQDRCYLKGRRLIGLWREGRCVEELFETYVP